MLEEYLTYNFLIIQKNITYFCKAGFPQNEFVTCYSERFGVWCWHNIFKIKLTLYTFTAHLKIEQ